MNGVSYGTIQQLFHGKFGIWAPPLSPFVTFCLNPPPHPMSLYCHHHSSPCAQTELAVNQGDNLGLSNAKSLFVKNTKNFQPAVLVIFVLSDFRRLTVTVQLPPPSPPFHYFNPPPPPLNPRRNSRNCPKRSFYEYCVSFVSFGFS